jgi:hypothetical protein
MGCQHFGSPRLPRCSRDGRPLITSDLIGEPVSRTFFAAWSPGKTTEQLMSYIGKDAQLLVLLPTVRAP